ASVVLARLPGVLVLVAPPANGPCTGLPCGGARPSRLQRNREPRPVRHRHAAGRCARVDRLDGRRTCAPGGARLGRGYRLAAGNPPPRPAAQPDHLQRATPGGLPERTAQAAPADAQLVRVLLPAAVAAGARLRRAG